MAPAEWAVGAQKLYLEGLMVSYALAAQKHQYNKFWPKMSEGWFSSWPEAQPTPEPEVVIDPDDPNPPPALTLQQRLDQAMQKAITKRLSVCPTSYISDFDLTAILFFLFSFHRV
jgi:hypothetical protein